MNEATPWDQDLQFHKNLEKLMKNPETIDSLMENIRNLLSESEDWVIDFSKQDLTMEITITAFCPKNKRDHKHKYLELDD